MKVIKRDGREEELNFSKMKKVIDYAVEGLDGVDALELEHELIPQFRNGITTKQIQDTLIKIAVEKTSVEQPNWQYVGARLALYNIYKEAGINRGYKHAGYGDFYSLVKRLTDMGLYGKYIMESYTKEEIEELGRYIKPERDLLLNYIGLRQLMDRYVISDNGKILELPQENFMGVAMTLAINEKDKMYWAKRHYDMLSQLRETVATPTLSNARKVFHQLSSCFIDMPNDDLISIYNTDAAFARVSKFGGGMGIYAGKIRAKGSAIRGKEGQSGGVVPWIRNWNNTAVSCNQLGVRNGAVSIYLDVWHKDILDFLQLRTNNGDERMKAHDIFPAVSVSDDFMRRVENREMFYLFCPYEVEKHMGFRLEDSFDETKDGGTFSERYQACINNPDLPRVEIPAIEVMKRIMQSAFETGTPFIFFRDEVNRMNPNKHAGMIYSSNLCTEILQNMKPMETIEETTRDGEIIIRNKAGDFVVCNLSSLNLGRNHTLEEIEETVTTEIRGMDAVIDLNYYPVKQAEITNKKYRAIGLGVHGYHQHLALKGIQWESKEHLEYVDWLFEWINYFSIKASMELAKEKGAYPLFKGSEWSTGEYFERRGYKTVHTSPARPDWDSLKADVMKYGVRNAYLFAIAPTGSTSLIAGSTAGIDPVYAKFWLEEKKNAIVPQTAPNLNAKTFWFYKEAHNVDQTWSIRANGVRQRHIDQSQSFNLYITPNINVKDFLEMYLLAWHSGVKTLYYVRNKSLEVDDCVSCSS